MFRLIVFDLDGTLVDSRRDIADSANLLLKMSRARPVPEDAIGRMVGDGAALLVARAFAAAGVPPPPDAATSICMARYGFGFEGFPVGDLGPTDRIINAPSDLLAL